MGNTGRRPVVGSTVNTSDSAHRFAAAVAHEQGLSCWACPEPHPMHVDPTNLALLEGVVDVGPPPKVRS